MEPRCCRPAGPSLIQSHKICLLISETETAVFVSLACVELQCNQTPKQQEANTNRWLEIEVVSQWHQGSTNTHILHYNYLRVIEAEQVFWCFWQIPVVGLPIKSCTPHGTFLVGRRGRPR